MGDDLRVRITKQLIEDSFVECLSSKPLDKITASEICIKADINRTTFYRYYNNPFDLYEKIKANLFKDLDSCAASAFAGLDSSDENKLTNAFSSILVFLKENCRTWNAIRLHEGGEAFTRDALRKTFAIFSKAPELNYPGVSEDEDRILRCYTGMGSSAVVTEWMESGMREDVDYLSRFLTRCARGVRSEALLNLRLGDRQMRQ